MRFTFRAALAAGVLVFVTANAIASDYTAEYDKKIKAAQDVGVLGNDLAGDRVNFYTGATSFEATDIAIPGNALGLSLSRSYTVESNHMLAAVKGTVTPPVPEVFSARSRLFGDWDLQVPHISTVMSQAGGWVVNLASQFPPETRCSVVGKKNAAGLDATGMPPNAIGTMSYPFGPGVYWHGYALETGGGEQSLLLASLPNPQRPADDNVVHYQWTTNQNWWISCLPQTANGKPGEAFLARSPDGTRYKFDWLSVRKIDSVQAAYDPDVMNYTAPKYLFRSEYLMLPTEIVDRFGNWVRYTWSNDEFARLIRVSNGPKDSAPESTIELSYNTQGHVSQATDGTRTWKYFYAQSDSPEPGPTGNLYYYYTLTRVELPDLLGQWLYAFDSLADEAPTPECSIDPEFTDPNIIYWTCFGLGDMPSDYRAGTVVHPSGAVVQFAFDNHFQYSKDNNGSYPLGLKSKTITGPGLSEATWSYDFVQSKEQIKAQCQQGIQYCPARWITDQINPDNSVVRRVFGLDTRDQSLLLAELEGTVVANAGGGSPAITASVAPYSEHLTAINPTKGVVPTWYRENVSTYADPNANVTDVGYVTRVGLNPLTAWTAAAPVQTFASERRMPVVLRKSRQQGVTFTSSMTTFDAYGRATSTTRSNSGSSGGNFSRVDATTYSYWPTLWVLGQVQSTRTNGEESTRTVYDSSTALPIESWRFGLKQQTFAYNANGTLASVADGKGNTITLSQWQSGVPKRIDYPITGVFETASVAPDGTVTSITDELLNTTQYSYDKLGRLTGITYPPDTAPVWSSLGRSFALVANPLYGLPHNVRSETMQTGTARTTVYYDARWHPVLTLTEDTLLSSSKSFVARRFDSLGRETFRSYPVGSVDVNDVALKGIVTEYDALGRPTKTKQSAEAPLNELVSTTEYLTGFQTRVTNPRSNVTTTSYQLFDAPSTESPVRIDAPAGVITEIVRDVYGNPLTITRRGPGG